MEFLLYISMSYASALGYIVGALVMAIPVGILFKTGNYNWLWLYILYPFAHAIYTYILDHFIIEIDDDDLPPTA